MDTKKHILLIEDDEVDVETVQRAFKDLKITNKLEVCSDGEEGLKYLKKMQNQIPCVILLDLNMPKMGGIELLEAIQKEDPSVRRIPVIILTTSKEEEDKVKSYDRKVAGYIAKPVEYHKFVEAMRALDMYWTISELPS